MNDIAKEVVSILDYVDYELIKKIPIKFLDYLKNTAKDSNKNVNIDLNKSLLEQNISEESKDLIALIYYNYFADENEKSQISKIWVNNEKIYQKNLEENYDLNSIFKNNLEKEYNKELPLVIKKEGLLNKIINFIKKIFVNKKM